MSHQEQRLTARDGLELDCRGWLPSGEPRATVIVVHGLCEHGGRYAHLADALSARGYAVYVADLRGHGRSAGQRAFIRSMNDYLDDLQLLADRVGPRQPGHPLFLLGHSMGGLIVLDQALSRPGGLHGLIVSGVALRVASGVFPVLRRLAPLASLIWPRLRLVRIGYRWLSRDPRVVAEFKEDPWVFHGRFPVRTGAEILRTARRVRRQCPSLRLPLLILHGTGDMVTDPGGSRLLYERAGSADKTLKLYPGVYHDLFHEPEHPRIIADIIAWLGARCPSARLAAPAEGSG